MKSKSILLALVALPFFMTSCHHSPSQEAMKMAAQTITEDFVTGNIDGFIASLDTTVRSFYPADEVLAAYQAISMIMGAPDKKSRDTHMEMVGKNPVFTVIVPYEGGKIAYQTGFDDKGNIIAFAPEPMQADIVYSEEEIIITPDSTMNMASASSSTSK